MSAVLALIGVLCVPGTAVANPPDLTAGGVPNNTRTTNLGPTGVRGWVYHVNSGGRRADSSESRQILVTTVAAGSPAAGVLAPDDVILGANGTGANPANFSYDARKALADAIRDAEARSPASLRLLRWRAGTTTTVTLSLQTLGAYSATAPYNCPKSALILQQGLQSIMAGETSGRYSFGTLSLLAANNPADPNNAARMTRARNEARALIPSAAQMVHLMSDERDATSMIVWQRGHTLIVLAEYYLLTQDADVLPAIEAYAVNIAKNSSLFGTMGHIFAEKNPDGSDNGPMGGQYGPVNNAGMPCFLGMILARKCGIDHPSIDPAIERMNLFFGYYAGKGTVPYGEHEPAWDGHENNGKSGLAALCYTLQDDQVDHGHYYTKMATASGADRELGHTGAFFNYVWAPLAAAAGGEQAAASHFSRIRWMLDLNRRWDGRFEYDCLNGEGPNSGSQYNDFRMSTAALLTYALPLRQLRITGKNHDPSRWLTAGDVAESAAVDGYAAAPRTTNQLMTDLGSWSPAVQRRAAMQLATRSIDTATLNQLTAMANDPNGSSRVGACLTLGRINNSGTANARATTLAALLTDPENHVRFMAAEGMRYLPQTAKMSQLNTILSAAASTAKPLFPFDEEDPLHFAHGRLAMLLFYGGNAYGPKGVIWNNLSGVNRNLLYPAIRAVAANPVGLARSCLYHAYLQLTAADVNALAETLVESVRFRAPSDKMFSGGIRRGGLEALEKYKIAEGVPLSMRFMVDDGRSDSYAPALNVLTKYAGRSTTVTPDPDVIGFCRALLSGPHAAAAQAVLNAIAADSNPAPLTSFKSVQATTADATSLNLPANQTTLRVTASDLAQGDSVFTWRKLHGKGAVSFTPNGTAAAKDTAVQFEDQPGQYLFEVTMSDSRGLTEVYGTVAVTLRSSDGTLPPNAPPTAHPQAVSASPASTTPITLTGTDPEGFPLLFTVTSQPANGSLTGTAPDLSYSSNAGHLGSDSFTFRVTDSEGQTSSATVSIDVSAAGIELYAYEGFDYAPGSNVLTPLNGGTGFAGPWSRGQQGGTITVYDQSGLWDGVVDGFPTSPANGVRYIGGAPGTTDGRITAQRVLSQSAGAMAGADKVLWASVVWKMNGSNFGRHVGLVLGTDGISNRSQNVDKTGTFGAGVGNAIGIGGAINTLAVTPVVFNNGNVAVRTTDGAANVSTTADNIIILKFVFADGAEPDRVYAYRFIEGEELSESSFNSNAVFAESVIDQNTLNILSFSQSRVGVEAIDEIRLGNSFAAVIGVEGPPPDTDPPTLVGIVDDREGEPVPQFTPMTYVVTFSEMMDPATVTASSFDNAGTANVTIGTVMQTLPGVFSVQVTPTSTGSLRLRIPSGALLTDMAGNPLDTTVALTDGTVLTVTTAMIDVPFVIGMSQSAAETEITGAGLTLGAIAYQSDANVAAGDIITQDPTGGTSVSPGSSVDLVVSLGMPTTATVPNVVGLSQSAAGSAITAANLVVGGITSQSSDTVPAGAVISQNPAGGANAEFESAVDLVVSLGDTTPPSPGPMTFAVAPQATGMTSIAMTATTATDANGVEYLFTNLTLGTDSGWQDSPVYEDTGLTPATEYIYTVTARDKSPNQNTGTPSDPASAATLSATDGTWNANAGGNWSDPANWLDGLIANGTGATATVHMTTAGNRTITLDSDRTVGNLTRNWAQNGILTLGGTDTLTLAGTSPAITNTEIANNRRIEITAPLAGTDGLTIAGGGVVWLRSNATHYTGATTVDGFINFEGIPNDNIGGGSGRNITLAAGSAIRFNALSNALLNRLVETDEEIVVMSGATGNALDFSGATGADLPNAFLGNWASNGAKMEFTGTITPAADAYRFGSSSSDGLLGIRSALTGPQGVIIGGNRVELVSPDNTFTGDTVIRAGRLYLGNNLALQNSPLNLGSSGGTIAFSDGKLGGRITGSLATDSPTFGGLEGSRDLNAVYNGTGPGNNANVLAAGDVLGFTLNVGADKTCTYSGNIADFSPATTLVKTGAGTQVFSGTHTYTGATSVNQGTLAFIGGSQASPITVASGASLGFTPGSPTTSTAAVDLTRGTVKIAGPLDNASDFLLLTASAITGSPALDEPIPDYELQVQNDGTSLVLAYVGTVGGSPYAAWSGGAPADEDTSGDGISNAIAWVLGAAGPGENALALLPVLDESSDAEHVLFTFQRATAAHDDPNTTIAVEYGIGLDDWTTAIPDGDHFIIEVTDGAPTDTVVVKFKRTAPALANGKLFVRLKVSVEQ